MRAIIDYIGIITDVNHDFLPQIEQDRSSAGADTKSVITSRISNSGSSPERTLFKLKTSKWGVLEL